jgi:hypothetical protein
LGFVKQSGDVAVAIVSWVSLGYPQARLVTTVRCVEGKVYIGISIELDAAGAKHESSDGRADAEQDCGCQAGDFKRIFFD